MRDEEAGKGKFTQGSVEPGPGEGQDFTVIANLTVFFFLRFIYLFLAVLGLRCCARLSLVAASGGYSSLRCTGFS